MTKIYQDCHPGNGDRTGLWVTRPNRLPRFFHVTGEYMDTSSYRDDVLCEGIDGGTLKIITHGEALDLLAHWPEGHAELAEILANDPESEYTVTDNEREAP